MGASNGVALCYPMGYDDTSGTIRRVAQAVR